MRSATAIHLNPNQPDAYHNLAILLSATHRTQEAVTCYCKALTLKPQYPEARRLLALAYCVIGQPDKAVIVCEEWLKSEPDDPVARHTLAAVSGHDVPTRASDAYVQKTFDSFAASSTIRRRRWWLRRWLMPVSPRHGPSMSWMPGAEPGSVVPSWHPMPAGWSE